MLLSKKEKAILVGCQIDDNDRRFYYSMDELASLTETAQGVVIGQVTQKREKTIQLLMLEKGN